MFETKQKNPTKRMAVMLAHQMDDELRIFEDDLPPWTAEEIRACGRQLRTEIFEKGYNIQELLYLAEEYKTLSFEDYREWVYR